MIPARQTLIRVLSMALVFVFLLTACSGSTSGEVSPTPTIPPTETLPPPNIRTTAVPSVGQSVEDYFTAWQNGDYEAMYAMLTAESKAETSLEAFDKLHRDTATELALQSLEYTLDETIVTPTNAEVSYSILYHSALVNNVPSGNKMQLINEDGSWRVVWSPGLIMPELADGKSLRLDLQVPERGSIFDRNGNLMAGIADAVAVGLYPDYLDPEKAESVISLLSRLTGVPVNAILGQYIDYPPGTVGYIPLGEVSLEDNQRLVDVLSGASGVEIRPYTARFYPGSGASPHAVGYVSSLQQGAEVDEYRQRGYRVDASIGRNGIEKWGEDLLAGKNGATLYLVDQDGKPQAVLGESPLMPSQIITTTLELDFQKGVQEAINGFTGAVVVLERDTGRVLAMASSPGFDPNAYQTANFNWSSLLQQIGNNPNQPLYNRATQGQYPLGSVFKVITLAAALESGDFAPQSTYDCQYTFEDLDGVTLYDWTWERYQDDGVTRPSGLLSLPEGLIRSCNPWFYHIGLELFKSGKGNAISDMARGFGLGEKTGIVGLDEEAGNIPVPGSPLDATNVATGQGEVQVTPLQVARFVAAIGNGGTLYQPQIIEAVGYPGQTPSQVFTPQPTGQLPISQENLEIIQKAMLGVTNSRLPVGTAYNTFNGFRIPVHGKTGTAETSAGEPHSWFAGYTAAGNANRPDIAVAVIAESQGEGSQWAAPIFRRVIELYFNGRPGKLYRWETSFGVTKTPTPFGFEATLTAQPEEP
jgi:penicillin-binding protein 2